MGTIFLMFPIRTLHTNFLLRIQLGACDENLVTLQPRELGPVSLLKDCNAAFHVLRRILSGLDLVPCYHPRELGSGLLDLREPFDNALLAAINKLYSTGIYSKVSPEPSPADFYTY
jgi:hypothetical protein